MNESLLFNFPHTYRTIGCRFEFGLKEDAAAVVVVVHFFAHAEFH
jgi:hypothetical protein